MAASEETWVVLGASYGTNRYRVSTGTVDMTRPSNAVRAVHVKAQPQEVVFDLGKTALLVIDMQNDFCAREGWVAQMGIDVTPSLRLAEPINRVTHALRRAAVPVIWLNWGVRPDRLNLSPGTQHPFNPHGKGPGLGGATTSAGRQYNLLEAGSWGAQVIAELDQEPSDVHVDKHRISGFWDTPLDSILRGLDVKTLIFAGVNTDHCVLSTLIDANFHGYDTILLEDCTGTFSPQFCYEATLHNVRFCFGFTTTSQGLVDGLRASSSS